MSALPQLVGANVLKTKRIQLRNRRHEVVAVAVIDAADAPLVKGYVWGLAVRGPNRYASGSKEGTLRVGAYMHRIIMNAPKGTEVDHIDGDGLNNHRRNLRVCSRQMNAANAVRHRDGTNPYKGVRYCRGKWAAGIGINYRRIYLGRFHTAEEAARAYDCAAKEAFGDFARLNFPEEVAS